MRRLAFLPILALLFFAHSAYAMREDVLVVVNDNSIDSPQVGAYYAQARNIDPAHIVHVQVPDQYTISWRQFLSLRDQILRFGICPTVPTSDQPAACAEPTLPIYTSTNISELTAHTPIKYIVTTMGVPTEMEVDASTLYDGGLPTSVDNYLMFWLAQYRKTELAAGQQPNSSTNPMPLSFPSDSWNRELAFGDGSGMRPVEPAVDGSYIIGRITGVNLASAEALINRAISAEQNGIYGTLYGDTFANTQSAGPNSYLYPSDGEAVWWDYVPTTTLPAGSPIYPEGVSASDALTTGWRYAFGLFNESDPLCIDYQSDYMSVQRNVANVDTTDADAPTHCLAQFRWGVPNDPMPGVSTSREPMPVGALAYFGSLDGQVEKGGFDTLLNWRKYGEGGSQVTLCANAANPKQCEGQSTDPYKEINTNVVGVANGFIGYNFQSFPVGRFGIWPTDWQHNEQFYDDVPVVATNDGVDDNYSLWYGQPDQVADPVCPEYTNTDGTSISTNQSPTPVTGLLTDTMEPCYAHRNIDLMQVLSAATTPSTYDVSFYMKGKNISAATNINAWLVFVYQEPSGGCPTAPTNYYLVSTYDTTCQYGATTVVSPPMGNSAWTLYTPLTNVSAPEPGFTFEKLEFMLRSTYSYQPNPPNLGININQSSSSSASLGSVGFDEISVKDTATGAELVGNGSFNEGHEQTANGDYAADFLDRLGGTAFWGSLSHHGSTGHNFASTSLGTLVYFMRGLPLGGAVWLGAHYPSGILYGDPLYSPTDIQLNYLNTDSNNRVVGNPTLSGSTINGRDPNDVSTSYAIDYCPGSDFYVCDMDGSWTSADLSGTGGQANQTFGTWNASNLPYGPYTLRLAVTSTNSVLNRSQTFDDYYTVVNQYSSTEIPTYSISGIITDANGQPMAGVKVEITDSAGSSSSVITDADGYYMDSGLKTNDTYDVQPVKTGYNFSPASGGTSVTIGLASISGKDFTGTQSTGLYSISGTITDTNGQPMPNVNVEINDNSGFSSSVTTNVDGYYSESGLTNNDTYDVQPVQTGYGFSVTSGDTLATIDNANVSGKDFTGAQSTGVYSISGTITNPAGHPLAGVMVDVNNIETSSSTSVSTNINGYYSAAGLKNDVAYYVQPVWTGHSFSVNSGNNIAYISNANVTGKDYTGKLAGDYSISGFVLTNGQPLPGVSVQVANNFGFSATVTTDASGYYQVKGLTNGWYVVFPTMAGYTILTNNSENDFQDVYDGNVIGKDFTATPQ